MKKIISIIMLIAAVGLLSGCIITDDTDQYERKQYQSSEKISKLVVKDLSSDITVQAADTDAPFHYFTSSDAVQQGVRLRK